MLTDEQRQQIKARWDEFRGSFTFPAVAEPDDFNAFVRSFHTDFGLEGFRYFTGIVQLERLTDADRGVLVLVGQGDVQARGATLMAGERDVTEPVKRLWNDGFCEVTVHNTGETWALTPLGEEATGATRKNG